jgi:hypothetical protein
MVSTKPAEDQKKYVGTWVFTKHGDHYEIWRNSEGSLVFQGNTSSTFCASDLRPIGGGWLEARLQGGGSVRFFRGQQEERMFSVWRHSESDDWSSTLVARLFPPMEMSSSEKGQSRQNPELVGAPPGLVDPVRDADTFVDSLLTACSVSENVTRAKPFQQNLLNVEVPACDYMESAQADIWSPKSGNCASECMYPSMSSELSAPRSMEFGEYFEASLLFE